VSETFLNGRVELHAGDSRDVLKTLADNSIDSIVTDPPYALVSIQKRFGKPGSAPVKVDDINESGNLKAAYARASAGFMGKQWDTGETAFAVEFWAECLRVLKPGGHVVAFSGTRTYHRMACAIEDAGFEIRDQLQWLYGSGFPKSHDVAKQLDKRGGALPRTARNADTFPVGCQRARVRPHSERSARA
jgi:DNA modification methylase